MEDGRIGATEYGGLCCKAGILSRSDQLLAVFRSDSAQNGQNGQIPLGPKNPNVQICTINPKPET